MRTWKIVQCTNAYDCEDLFLNELMEWEARGWMVHLESFNARLGSYYVLLSKESR